LRTINRSETAPEFNEFTSTTSPEPDVPRPSNSTGSETTYSDSFYSTIADLLPRLSDNPSEEIEASNQPSTSQNVNRTPPPMSRRDAVSSNNDNRYIENQINFVLKNIIQLSGKVVKVQKNV